MYFFNVISLLGGLALFLYGMRLMGNSLKEGQSGTLKVIMGKVTDNPVKAFLLGLLVTAVIQSSTATIVITSGLVAAGIISLNQSLGIIVGANVGTTVTGQIIRLLDVNGDSFILRLFQPSTLAPIALILGIIFIMFFKFKKSDNIGNIAVGFGILFIGLLDNLWDSRMTSGSIANTNTVFNLACAVIMLPFMKLLGKTSRKMIKDKVTPDGKYDDKIAGLNPVFFNTPAIHSEYFGRLSDMMV